MKLRDKIEEFAETYQVNLKIDIDEKNMKPIILFNNKKLNNVEESDLFDSVLTTIMLKDRTMDQELLNKFKEKFL